MTERKPSERQIKKGSETVARLLSHLVQNSTKIPGQKETQAIIEIVLDYMQNARVLKREHGLTIPLVTSEEIALIEPQLRPIHQEQNPIRVNKAIELSTRELILEYARGVEQYGHNFQTGAGFAFLVFGRLNEQGHNFTPIEPETVQIFKEDYQNTLDRWAKTLEIDSQDAQTRTGFYKFMLLFAGFLHPSIHEKENPELIKLFRSFSASRPFAEEGSMLVYELKIAQYQKNIHAYRAL